MSYSEDMPDLDADKIVEAELDYCERDPMGYKQCLKRFLDMGIRRTVDVLVDAGLLSPNIYKSRVTREELRHWEWLTKMAIGNPKSVAEHLIDEVATYCFVRHTYDPLGCLEKYTSNELDEIFRKFFLPLTPIEIKDKIIRNYDPETLDRIKEEYKKLWEKTYREWKSTYFNELNA